ncbi:MAG: polysaccharide deacetylase family protein [Bacteroidales bacterium]
MLGGLARPSPRIRATTWKDNRKGALSFTFDDGAAGAFRHGADCLDQAGLKGTFYIFSDTTKIYDFPIADSALVSAYRIRGFEIASHTLNHANLGTLTGEGKIDSVRSLLRQSKAELDARYRQNTLSLSIPYGSFRYETLDLIAETFATARSSRYGYNLATPLQMHALKSLPVLSTTSVEAVLAWVRNAEHYGSYLPLMYHEIAAEAFDPATAIYTYALPDLQRTIDSVLQHDLWVDTHENVYKYIRERNALTVETVATEDGTLQFMAEDGLPDSVFDVELTLWIPLPADWGEDSATLVRNDELVHVAVSEKAGNRWIFCNLPPDGSLISIHDGLYDPTLSAPPRIPSTASPLLLYPNPVASGELHFRAFLPSSGPCSIQVFDARGRLAYSSERGSQAAGTFESQIPTTGLASGLYTLLVRQGVDVLGTGSFLKIHP